MKRYMNYLLRRLVVFGYWLLLIQLVLKIDIPPQAQAKAVADLNVLETGIIEEMNLARQYPQQYAKFLQDTERYYQDRQLIRPGDIPYITQEGVSAVQEAVDFLEHQLPLDPLEPVSGLSQAAQALVAAQGSTGQTGHVAPSGATLLERVEHYGQWRGQIGENIAYGPERARDIVQQLIIDDGVLDRGHREALFNPQFHEAGVACGPHRVFKTMCVITYAADFVKRS